jgi:uncharacterized integral membrane protein
MQIFLFVALAVAFLAVLFALQNIVPVTVSFMAWTFEGSLALVLFVAFVAGALVSVLVSVPSLVTGRWAASQHRKQMAALEESVADTRRALQEAEARLRAQTTPPRSAPGPEGPSTLEPSS